MCVVAVDIHRIVHPIIQVLVNAIPHLVHIQHVPLIVAYIHQRPQKLVHLVPVVLVKQNAMDNMVYVVAVVKERHIAKT